MNSIWNEPGLPRRALRAALLFVCGLLPAAAQPVYDEPSRSAGVSGRAEAYPLDEGYAATYPDAADSVGDYARQSYPPEDYPADDYSRQTYPLEDYYPEPYTAESQPGEAAVEVVILTPEELDEVIGPIALYPDDLLAIVLPASTYPLQIVQAARFLDAVDAGTAGAPDPDWDESVTALLNYPKVLRTMHADLDWTWRLGGAVLNQQPDVIAAVESFRDRAYAAGNLRSDEYQTVTYTDDSIEIEPASPEVIYVPYYEPRQVIVRQVEPVYYYYPEPCPVYYYPYPAGHRFLSGYFWGVTTAFTIGWSSRALDVHYYGFYSHPYRGHRYSRHHYRRPSISIHYGWNRHRPSHGYRYRDGVRWRPGPDSGARPVGHDHDRPHDDDRPSYRDRDRDRLDPAIARQPGGDASIVAAADRRGRLRADRDLADRVSSTHRPERDRRPVVTEQSDRKPASTRRPARDDIRFRERPDTVRAGVKSPSRYDGSSTPLRPARPDDADRGRDDTIRYGAKTPSRSGTTRRNVVRTPPRQEDVSAARQTTRDASPSRRPSTVRQSSRRESIDDKDRNVGRAPVRTSTRSATSRREDSTSRRSAPEQRSSRERSRESASTRSRAQSDDTRAERRSPKRDTRTARGGSSGERKSGGDADRRKNSRR